jgi:glycosyltransferase involved in cell wall biosynthesis
VVSLGGDNRIAQERNGSFYLGSKRLSYGVEWLTLQLATSIIAPNSFTKGYVGSIIGPRRASAKCVVIPWLSAPVPASDAGDRNLLAGLGIAPGTIVVPVIGFVNRYKYSDVLFDAIAQGPIAAPGNAPVLVCFLGDGPLRQEGEARFADRPDVRFLGWQERQVVHAFLRCADVVLIPMSGFVLLEAASLGKTVISSRVEWHGELIRDGETGYLVDPTSPAAWRQALARALAEDPQHRRQMSARLLALYQAEYALDIAVRRELELYLSLTSKAAAPQ